MHNEKLTLANLCGGAIQEKMDRAIEKVARNILDPNTDPKKKRSITLKLIFQPDEDDNEDVDVQAQVSVSLIPEQGTATKMFMTEDLETGRITVMEHKKGEIRGQLDFSDWLSDGKTEVVDYETGEITEAEEGKVIDMRKSRVAK